jgi:FkbM family methyltransferase
MHCLRYIYQVFKFYPRFQFKLKWAQKWRHGLGFFQDHHHCLGRFSRRYGYLSQNGQDYFLDQKIFHQKTKGVFVDVGTFEPEFDNATIFFEKYRNWTGLAIEPQLAHVDKWRLLRKSPIVHAAASRSDGTAEFVVVNHPDVMNYNAWSGLKSSIANEKMNQLPDGAYRSSISVPTISISKALDQNGIKEVDFLSIDVEGHELEVLSGIDFKRHSIKCIVIENDILPEGDPIIHNFLKEQGYKYIARLTSDDVFVKYFFKL